MKSFKPAAPIPLRSAVHAGEWVALSGQVGHIDYQLVDGGVEGQLRQALTNMREALAREGASMQDVVKTNVYLTSTADFDVMNSIYLEFFGLDSLPARTAVTVAGLPFGALIELEAWAYLGNGTESQRS